MAGMRQLHGEYSRLSHSPSLQSSTSIGGKKHLDAFQRVNVNILVGVRHIHGFKLSS